MDEKVISKMSIKSIGCNPKAASAKNEADKTPVVLCVIFGNAVDAKTWEDNRIGRVCSCLIGDFGGINLQQGTPEYGQSFRSGKLFLPDGIYETVETAVLGDGSKDPNSVEFAFELQAVRATNPIGYSYQAIPRIRPVAEDPLARIRAMVSQQIQLPVAPTAPPQMLAPQQPAVPMLPPPAAPIGDTPGVGNVTQMPGPAEVQAPPQPAARGGRRRRG